MNIRLPFRIGILIAFSIAACCCSYSVFGQRPNTDPTGDAKWAKAYLMTGDFVTALKEYQLVIKKDSADPEVNYNLATCYLNTNINKEKALPYMEYASKQPKMDPIVIYDLGRAYQIVYRFDEAIEAFTRYKATLTGEDMNYITAEEQIAMCLRAKEMIQHPLNVTFENLGARINGPSPDYSPFITADETLLHFTSKRAGNIGNLVDYDGYYTADLFYVEMDDDGWDKCKRLATTINTPLIEEMAGLSEDGSIIFAFVDNLDVRYQVQMGIKNGKSFQYMLPMGDFVNPKGEGATAVTIFNDKKTIIFAAERGGGVGGSDLYQSRLLPDNTWGQPIPLGNQINTEYDEDYPQLSPDNKKLYFASVGHGSMGGFDIFCSEWDSIANRWKDPVNLGYPINTPDDDLQISFTASGRYAYTSTLRPEGYGNLDIYRLILNDVPPPKCVFYGKVSGSDSVDVFKSYHDAILSVIDSLTISIDSAFQTPDSVLVKIDSLRTLLEKSLNVEINVYDSSKTTLLGKYKPDQRTGNYVMILSPGYFAVQLKCEGFKDSWVDIEMPERESPTLYLRRDLVVEN